MTAKHPSLSTVLPGIRGRATDVDLTGEWPREDLHMLAKVGALRWAVPLAMDGQELSPIELHFRYEAIASASLTAALVLSQRDSAVAFLEAAEQSPVREPILRELAAGHAFATIGIAQLTTSRQGTEPALRFKEDPHGFVLDGTIPWSTGAGHSRYIVAGAAGDDGSQLLFVLPTELPGVKVEPPMQLVALRGSWTSTVRLEQVRLSHQWVLHGPAQDVLSLRRRTLPVGQAFLALGLCRGALELIQAHKSDLARDSFQRFSDQLEQTRQRVLDLCGPGRRAAPGDAAEARGACNDLAVRLTHAAVTLYKGTALALTHPAQRLAREAMFLLVWSCPIPVIDCTMQRLAAHLPV